jgi:hypothetical protein
MNWRLMGGILGGLLLVAPLALLLASTTFQLPRAHSAGDARLSPVLTEEERRQLMTYGRDCVHRADCDAPLGCLPNTRARRTYCTDSQCETDAQCPERFSCVPLHTVEEGPLVRFCIPAGVRKEGESCIEVPRTQEYACEPGLRCADGWCGRPCQLDNPASCPDGLRCTDFSPGPTCRPTCEGRTCPPGKACIRDPSGASVCAVVYGFDCQDMPCPSGKECSALFASSRPGRVWMSCVPECSKESPLCPQGRICTQGSCLKPCEPNGPNVCEEGFRCYRFVESQPWACRHDME